MPELFQRNVTAQLRPNDDRPRRVQFVLSKLLFSLRYCTKLLLSCLGPTKMQVTSWSCVKTKLVQELWQHLDGCLCHWACRRRDKNVIWAFSCSCPFPAWHTVYLRASWLKFSLMSMFLWQERKSKNPVLLCLKHCCGCGGSRCSSTCQCFSFFMPTTSWSVLAWRQSCEEPTMNSNHRVGQLNFAFGNAAKDSVEEVLLKWPACGGIRNSCPWEV